MAESEYLSVQDTSRSPKVVFQIYRNIKPSSNCNIHKMYLQMYVFRIHNMY